MAEPRAIPVRRGPGASVKTATCAACKGTWVVQAELVGKVRCPKCGAAVKVAR